MGDKIGQAIETYRETGVLTRAVGFRGPVLLPVVLVPSLTGPGALVGACPLAVAPSTALLVACILFWFKKMNRGRTSWDVGSKISDLKQGTSCGILEEDNWGRSGRKCLGDGEFILEERCAGGPYQRVLVHLHTLMQRGFLNTEPKPE